MKTQSKIVDGMDFGSKVMPQAKVDALIKEFPFIKNLLINVQVLKIPLSQIYVTVAEEKILSYSPVHHCEQDIPFFELSFFFEKMIFLGKHGERVKINLQIPKKRKYLLFGPRKIQTMCSVENIHHRTIIMLCTNSRSIISRHCAQYERARRNEPRLRLIIEFTVSTCHLCP